MLKTIQALNDKKADLARRVLKLQEEAGELAEAYLNVTSKHNKKNKSWEDVREEAIDCAIVAIDIAFSIKGCFEGLSEGLFEPSENSESSKLEEYIYEQVQEVFARKLDKWKRSRDTGTDVIEQRSKQVGKIEEIYPKAKLEAAFPKHSRYDNE